MKLAVIIDRLNIGGVEKAAIEEVRAFRALGEDARLVVLSRSAVVNGALTDLLQGLPVEYLDDRLPAYLRIQFKFPFFSFFNLMHITYPLFLPWVFRYREYDYMIVHNTYTAFSALTISKLRKVPYVYIVWDPIVYIIDKVYTTGPLSYLREGLTMIARVIDRMLMVGSIGVITFGQAHVAYLSSLRSGRTISVIPHGVHFDRVIPKRRGVYFLALTAWKRGKGIEHLVRLLHTMPGLTLHIVGVWLDKDYYREVVKLVGALGLRSRISFVTSPDQNDLAREYRGARALVTINNEKGFNMPAIEAAAHGCPFVVTKDSGVAKHFTPQHEALYYSYRDMKKLNDILSYLSLDERAAYKIGETAYAKIVKRFSWKQHVQKIRKFLVE